MYSTIIEWGKHWQQLYLEGMVGNYLANLNLNKTICAYIITVGLKASKHLVLEAICLNRCLTLLHKCNQVCNSL